MRGLMRFAGVMGPLSSAVRPADLRRPAAASSMPRRTEFRTAWFLESMATQILVIFIIRTNGRPWSDRPHPALTMSSLVALAVAMIVPFSPIGGWFGFQAPPLDVTCQRRPDRRRLPGLRRAGEAVGDRGSARQPEPFAAIGAAHDALPPAPVVEVPAHGLAQAVLEIVARPPAELALDLAGVDGVAGVVARPVGDELRSACSCGRFVLLGSSSSSSARRSRAPRRCSAARCRRRHCRSRRAGPCAAPASAPRHGPRHAASRARSRPCRRPAGVSPRSARMMTSGISFSGK